MTHDIATIRKALPPGHAHNVLDRVAARLASMDRWKSVPDRQPMDPYDAACMRADEAEERADTLERELAALMEDAVKNVNYWKDREYEARAEADRLRETLVQTGCVGDHYCPGNEGFIGDMYGDGYDPEKWPLCARCAALAGPQAEEQTT